MTTYDQFLAGKQRKLHPIGTDAELNARLFPFQRDITRWALRLGRAAIWAECGLGKSWMALEWSRVMVGHTGMPGLILCPLAVAGQFELEAAKLGMVARHIKGQSDVDGPAIYVCNYDRLHRLDPSAFGSVVLDESSILKDYTAKTRTALIETFADTPYRLACTATPAPNDHIEIGNHAEFLGLCSRSEMLATYFVHDSSKTQDWRLKGHAVDDFWRWVASWAVALNRPSDLGYDDTGYALPPLNIHHHMVELGHDDAQEAGFLFAVDAIGLSDTRAVRTSSVNKRADLAASLVTPDRPWLLWCDLNRESDALKARLNGTSVVVTGSDDIDVKEAHINAFGRGEIPCLITKPSIAGWGVNWQVCSDVVFVGVDFSFEKFYQAIRRTWRFGQTRPVQCHIVTTDRERALLQTLKHKQKAFQTMTSELSRRVSLVSEVHA